MAEAPRELEPRPSAYDEDELDEVGRPEGPIEERRVDPFAWQAPREEVPAEATDEPRPGEDEPAGWPPPPSFGSSRSVSERDDDEVVAADREREGRADETVDRESEVDQPSRETATTADRPASLYGRRPGRARKGR